MRQTKKEQMKIIFIACIIAVCFCFTNTAFAQYGKDIGYEKGDVELALGLGLMNTFVDINTKAIVPPLSILFNYRLKKTISIGTYMGFSKTVFNPPTETVIKVPESDLSRLINNHFQTGIRFQGHYTRDRIDFYGGAMLGYAFSIKDYDNLVAGKLENLAVEGRFSDAVIFSGFIGGKYLMTENFGIYGEIGYGISIFNLGLTSRF